MSETRFGRVCEEYQTSPAPPAHLFLYINRLRMSSVGGATSEAGALVGELSSDLVGVAPANDGQFRKTFHAPTGP